MPHMPIADAHSDLLMELVDAEHRLEVGNPFRARWLPPLRAGGVALQVCAMYADPRTAPDAALRELLCQARSFQAAVEANRETVFAVETASDLDDLGGERIGLLLAVEGLSALRGDAWLVDVLASLGVRMASLTWNERNELAGGADHETAGLTALGADVLERLSAHGIAIDLAHASSRTVTDVLPLVSDQAVLVSHAACRALYDHPRNLSDEQLRALAAADGVLGLMPHPFVLGVDATLDTFVDHVEHAVDVMGPAHVGLGGDFLRQIARAMGEADELLDGLRADAALEELQGPQDYPVLTAALGARGLGDDAIRGILGGNLVRLLRRSLPQAG